MVFNRFAVLFQRNRASASDPLPPPNPIYLRNFLFWTAMISLPAEPGDSAGELTIRVYAEISIGRPIAEPVL
jgi:hypothetical protein